MSDVTYWSSIWNRKLWSLAASRRLKGPALKSGIFTGKEKRNESCKQEDAADAKEKKKISPACSEIFCCESCHQGFSSEVHSLKSSQGLRNHGENDMRQDCGNNGSQHAFAWLLWENLLFLASTVLGVLCKMPHRVLQGNSVFSLNQRELCVQLRAQKTALST